jgi:hypothetical protein
MDELCCACIMMVLQRPAFPMRLADWPTTASCRHVLIPFQLNCSLALLKSGGVHCSRAAVCKAHAGALHLAAGGDVMCKVSAWPFENPLVVNPQLPT